MQTTGLPERPGLWQAIKRGWAQQCPRCGDAPAYRRFLKVVDTCDGCGEELSEYRADDAPPYFTILIVGHVVVPLMLMLEQTAHPPLWVHAVLWGVVSLGLTLWLLPRVKGAVLALMMHLRMKGEAGTSQ